MSHVVSPNVAVIIGVGPGLGRALCRTFADEGFKVAAASRDKDRIEPYFKGIRTSCYSCDVTREEEVENLFQQVEEELGPPDVVVFNAGKVLRKPVVEMEVSEFEEVWMTGCLGAFIVGRRAARAMEERGKGTILFTGATAALRGGANFAAFAAAKHGLRALSQSMAREMAPKGVHVAHVVVDGLIGESDDHGKLDPMDLASNYLSLHRQPRSAWTQELDLRPWLEHY